MAIKKTGGPKTAEGKLVASRNSLKTGTYSKLVVLPNESQEEFEQLVDQFNLDFYPKDVFEITLVRELAVITWKKLRLEKLEQAFLIKKLNDPITLEEFSSCGDEFNSDRYIAWTSPNNMEGYNLENFTSALKYLKPYLQVNMTIDQIRDLKKNHPSAYEFVLVGHRKSHKIKRYEPTEQDLLDHICLMPDGSSQYLIPYSLGVLNSIYSAVVWCVENREKVKSALAHIKQERLLTVMKQGSAQRAGDDLHRAMIRTISEYRKHHEWRLKNHTMNTQESLK